MSANTISNKKRKPVIKRSWVWKYFSIIKDSKKVVCIKCNKEQDGSGPTSNLAYHLLHDPKIDKNIYAY